MSDQFENQFQELTCETTEENRDNIQWIFNGRYVVDGDFDQDFRINKNILKIKNIQLYHTGQYECSGTDDPCKFTMHGPSRTNQKNRSSGLSIPSVPFQSHLTVHLDPFRLLFLIYES